MRQALSYIIHFAVEFLFPRSRLARKFALAEAEEWRTIFPPSETFPKGFASFSYDHAMVQELVWDIKYRGDESLARKAGEIMWEDLLLVMEDELVFEDAKLVLLPSPQSRKRFLEKGFNQAEMLSRAMEEASGGLAKTLSGNLIKTKDTPHQTSLPKEERLSNLQYTFELKNPAEIKGAVVIFVDDVATTGATIEEAHRVARQAKCARFYAITLAH